MRIAVDFDGTVVTHEYPAIGVLLPDAKRVLKRLVDEGHYLYLWTCRSGSHETAAWRYMSGVLGIPLRGVNKNHPDDPFGDGGIKLFADLYIDDRGLGIPLVYPKTAPPFVCWRSVEILLENRGILRQREEAA